MSLACGTGRAVRSSMGSATQLRAPLGFSRPDDVGPDHEREGMRRARTMSPGDETSGRAYDMVSCDLRDCAEPSTTQPGLLAGGWEAVDLASNAALVAGLQTVRADDRIEDDVAEAIQASLMGSVIPLADGSAIRVEFISEDGLIHRRAGPNGLDVNPGGMDGMNGHDGAAGIHGDQDVFGTPLRQTMAGKAPEVFRHQTPDGSNLESTTMLLNLWMPVQQATRPLVLMDRRTLDQQRDQLRYGLPVGGFLDRDEDARINDIWTFLADEDQDWYFHSTMGLGDAYLFDTLGTPHGSCCLPGEDVLEQFVVDLRSGQELLARGDVAAAQSIAARLRLPLPEVTTEPIRDAWKRLGALLDELRDGPADDWSARAEHAIDSVIRKSVELRLVGSVITA